MKYRYILILIIFISCKTEVDNKPSNRNIKSKNLYINGTADESSFIKYFNLSDESNFYNKNYKFKSKSTNEDSISFHLNNINYPQVLEIMAFQKNLFHNTRIFVTPGDSVQFELKKGILKFFGKNAEHYNFFLEMDRKNREWATLSFSKFKGDFESYKRKCDSLYNKRLNFLNNYTQINKNVSNEFVKTIKEEFYLEHLLNLIKPRAEFQGGYSTNTQEDIASILENSRRKEGNFLDMNKYLDDVKVEDLNKPHLINNLYFKMSIVPLIRQYFVKSNEVPYSKEAFIEELSFLERNFDSKIVKYTTGRLIVDYYNRGFGKDENTNQFMKKIINDYMKTITDSTYIEAITDIENELSALNKKLPKDLKELALNLSKDTISLNYVLQKKKIKVIDFWASWCSPCIEEIIKSKEQRDKIIDKFNIEFIYLSLDSDTEKWIDKSIDLSNYLTSVHQYKVLKPKKSNFIKKLNIRASYGLSIPRYVILDENNKIINNNAPKPSNSEFEEIIAKISY
jgi:thiol-disulfide isomerase/thioredoxin